MSEQGERIVCPACEGTGTHRVRPHCLACAGTGQVSPAMAAAVRAQSPYTYSDSSSRVTVDYSVLDRLGPAPRVPDNRFVLHVPAQPVASGLQLGAGIVWTEHEQRGQGHRELGELGPGGGNPYFAAMPKIAPGRLMVVQLESAITPRRVHTRNNSSAARC